MNFWVRFRYVTPALNELYHQHVDIGVVQGVALLSLFIIQLLVRNTFSCLEHVFDANIISLHNIQNWKKRNHDNPWRHRLQCNRVWCKRKSSELRCLQCLRQEMFRCKKKIKGLKAKYQEVETYSWMSPIFKNKTTLSRPLWLLATQRLSLISGNCNGFTERTRQINYEQCGNTINKTNSDFRSKQMKKWN